MTGVVVITGGASRIGEACVRRFATDDYKIAVLDVNMDKAQAVAADLDDAISITCDVADRENMSAAIAEVTSKWGRIDICVASAGILENASTVLDADPEAHDQR